MRNERVLTPDAIRKREEALEMLRDTKASDFFQWVQDRYTGTQLMFPEENLPCVMLQGPWTAWADLGANNGIEVSSSISITVGIEEGKPYVSYCRQHRQRRGEEELPGGKRDKRLKESIMTKAGLLTIVAGTIERTSLLNPMGGEVNVTPIYERARQLESA